MFVYLAYLPAVFFWILDGYYLYQERLYRCLYNKIRSIEPDEIDFDMNASDFCGTGNANWVNAAFSMTMLLFHGVLIATILVVMTICIMIARTGGQNA